MICESLVLLLGWELGVEQGIGIGIGDGSPSYNETASSSWRSLEVARFLL